MLGYFVYFLGKIHIVISFLVHDHHEHYSKLSLLFVILMANLSSRFILTHFLERFVSFIDKVIKVYYLNLSWLLNYLK